MPVDRRARRGAAERRAKAAQRLAPLFLDGLVVEAAGRRSKAAQQEGLALPAAAAHKAKMGPRTPLDRERDKVAPLAIPVVQVRRALHDAILLGAICISHLGTRVPFAESDRGNLSRNATRCPSVPPPRRRRSCRTGSRSSPRISHVAAGVGEGRVQLTGGDGGDEVGAGHRQGPQPRWTSAPSTTQARTSLPAAGVRAVDDLGGDDERVVEQDVTDLRRRHHRQQGGVRRLPSRAAPRPAHVTVAPVTAFLEHLGG